MPVVGHEFQNALEQTAATFDSTNWSLVDALVGDDARLREESESRLVEVYWPPVYACATRLTRSRDEAADLTQAFFAEVVLERRLFEVASPTHGSLRSLMRTALKRYAIDRWRRETVRGRDRTVSLSSLGREDALLGDFDADTEFDRRWALVVLERAMSLCQRHFERAGLMNHWNLFECRVVHPASRGVAAPRVGDLAARFGFETTAQASAAIQTVKRRLSTILRQVVCESVRSGADAHAEYELVLRLLSQRGQG